MANTPNLTRIEVVCPRARVIQSSYSGSYSPVSFLPRMFRRAYDTNTITFCAYRRCTRLMEADSNRIVQVFFWKQGAAPDLDYVRQVLSIVNPEAFAAIAGDNPPVQLFSVIGPWPDDPWTRALQDMRAIPSISRIAWTDPNQYELNGWQGSDLRTGDHIFTVVAY